MRTTAAMMKGVHATPLQTRPRPGTKIRAAYDWFVANPLKPIRGPELTEITRVPNVHSIIEYLRNYELDIRHGAMGYVLYGSATTDYLMGDHAS